MDKQQYEELKKQKEKKSNKTNFFKFFDKTILVVLLIIAIISGGVYYLYREYKATEVNSSFSVSKEEELIKTFLDIGHIYGSKEPKVVLAEFSDFQCPACGAYYPLMKQIKEDFKDEMAFVYIHFPLKSIHANAEKAARASEAAAKQGKFWEMHDIIFEKQKEWDTDLFPFSKFKQYAQEIGLNTEQFEKDYNSDEVKKIVNKHLSLANKLNLRGTPTFFLQGKMLERNPNSIEEFRSLIEKAKNNPLNISLDNKEEEGYHVHADIKVIIFDKEIDFSKEKYQSTEDKELSPWQHFHDGNGNVMHQHKEGLTLSNFFKSLGFNLTDECIELPQDEAVFDPFAGKKETEFCTGAKNSLKLYVNGKLLIDENTRKPIVGSYEIKDLDRLLIIYDASDLENVNLDDFGVTNDACIYSEKCPERGKPPHETCVGGLGTKCEE